MKLQDFAFPEQRAAMQDAFAAVWTHFVVNGAPPSFMAGTCLYRGKEGARCAIGVLLTDEDYAAMSAQQQTMNVSGLMNDGFGFRRSPLVNRVFPDCAVPAFPILSGSNSQRAAASFLLDLQACHDAPILEQLNHADGWRAGSQEEAYRLFGGAVRAKLEKLAREWNLEVPA